MKKQLKLVLEEILSDWKTIILEEKKMRKYIALDISHGEETKEWMMGKQTIVKFTMAHVNSLASWYATLYLFS